MNKELKVLKFLETQCGTTSSSFAKWNYMWALYYKICRKESHCLL